MNFTKETANNYVNFTADTANNAFVGELDSQSAFNTEDGYNCVYNQGCV